MFQYFGTRSGVATLSVASNSFLVIAKLVVGISMGSVSVIAESIHSGIDLLAAIIAFIAVRGSGRPADNVHPFGHGKMENLSGTIEAVLIFLAAGIIIFQAINKIMAKTVLEEVGLGMIVMGLSAAVNWFVSTRLMRVAKREDSLALEADSLHLRTDIYTSIGVFLGLILIKVTGIPLLDPIVAMAVALMIIRAAWDLTRRSAYGLLDTSLPAAELALIQYTISENYPELVEIHALRSRKAGAQRFIDLHMVVCDNLSVCAAHSLCDRIELDIENRLPHSSVTIHVEPCSSIECSSECTDGKSCPQKKKAVAIGGSGNFL